MNNEGLPDVLNLLIESVLSNKFTIIPATVLNTTTTYNNKPFVDVRPIIRSRRSSGELYEFEDQYEVPLFVYSAGQGNIKITLPVKVGDTVLLLFSQRDRDTFLDSDGKEVVDPTMIEPLGEYPICALPSIYTSSTDVTVDPDNIDIVNTLSNITLKPDGNIDINGCTITPKGNVITKAGTDLDELKALHDTLRAEYDLHTHTGNLGAPTSPPL